MMRTALVVELSATTDLTAEATDEDDDEVVNDDITVTVTNTSNMSYNSPPDFTLFHD